MESLETVEQLTLFQQDTLASHLVTPGSDEARKMTVTSGRKLLAYYKKSDPVGLLAKMLLDTSLWASTTCSLTWVGRATPHKRLLFQLRPSAQATDEIEYSLWPAPHANCHTGSGEKGGGGMNIQTAVKMWPTPRANDAEKRGNVSVDPRNGLPGAVKLWPTPAAQDAKNSTFPPSQYDRDTIPGAVMRSLWPTPTASQDWKPIRPLAPSEANGSHGTMLVGAVGHQEPQNVGGQLNPEWVEALMCFPIGWTDVE